MSLSQTASSFFLSSLQCLGRRKERHEVVVTRGFYHNPQLSSTNTPVTNRIEVTAKKSSSNSYAPLHRLEAAAADYAVRLGRLMPSNVSVDEARPEVVTGLEMLCFFAFLVVVVAVVYTWRSDDRYRVPNDQLEMEQLLQLLNSIGDASIILLLLDFASGD